MPLISRQNGAVFLALACRVLQIFYETLQFGSAHEAQTAR
jgi:hypothetical protein